MFENLIGLEEKKARQFLEKNGYNNIETVINSKHNDLCDTLVVCAIREKNADAAAGAMFRHIANVRERGIKKTDI